MSGFQPRGHQVDEVDQDRVTMVCFDDYHAFDREARKTMTITPLNPGCNYLEIMEQHLALLAAGEPILKPVYNHHAGTLDAPEMVVPTEIVIIEGLLAFHTKAMRECFDVKVYLDPPEDMRGRWKVERDCSKRGYENAEVLRQLTERETDSAAFIRPQGEVADIVVRFHPPGASLDVDRARLDVRVVLRPSLAHPYLLEVAENTRVDHVRPIRVSLARDNGKPVDIVEVEASMVPKVSAAAEQVIWSRMHDDGTQLDRHAIGLSQDGARQRRSESLAL
ncbi:MAG TPA: phosphoribulokinase, partial [Candidatus Dormibacteraeota bacterium]|nr:phosphoribulokinase [Candidatus Dormibacteraeota bacterium]